MRAAWLLVPLIATGCGRSPDSRATGPGDRIEASAIAAGMVGDPAHATLIGSWARESDRMCVVPDGARSDRDRVGISVDYGNGQACLARGLATRGGDRLSLAFGDCRIEAGFDGDRIRLPARVPPSCDRLCIGRASLAAITVDRQSDTAADAAAVIATDGRPLCPA